MGGGGRVEQGSGLATMARGASPGPKSSEFEANAPQQMPVYNSPTQLEAARRKRTEVLARSGRGSTNLVGNPGTKTFTNSFLGSVT